MKYELEELECKDIHLSFDYHACDGRGFKVKDE